MAALLQGLLRRNAKDRMEFDDFFNHSFIRKNQQSPVSPPLPVLASVRLSTPPRMMPVASSPTTAANTNTTANVTANLTGQNNNATTPEEADDFVLVPSPSQLRSRAGSSGATNHNEGDASAQPIPVPSQRGAFLKV